MTKAIKTLIEKLKTKTEKLSPTAADVHVPVPMGSDRDEHVKKILSDYEKVNSKLKTLNNKKTETVESNDNKPTENTEGTVDSNPEVYRGKSF